MSGMSMQQAWNRLREIDKKVMGLSGAAAVGFGQVSQAAAAAIELGNRPPDPDRGALVDGPFVFCGNVAPGITPASTLVADLTTYSAATGTGPISSNLFPQFQATAGQPNCLLFVSELKFEVDADTLGGGGSVAEILENLELFVSVGQGQKTYRRSFPLVEAGGTVTHYSSSATTAPATTIQQQHKKAVSIALPDCPPVFFPTSTFELRTNGKGIPTAPGTLTPVYITIEGFAVHNVNNAFDIQNVWTNPSTSQREAFDEISALMAEKRAIKRMMGVTPNRRAR